MGMGRTTSRRAWEVGMASDGPTILATSGGIRRGARSTWGLGPLILFGVELSGVTGRRPRICLVGTAGGGPAYQSAFFSEAAQAAGMEPSLANLYPMPNHDDMTDHLLAQDLVWVGGGSVANLV